MKLRGALYLSLLIFQVLCAVLFGIGFLSTVTGVVQINWALYELIEIAAALGLIIGAALGAIMLRNTMQQHDRMAGQLRAASGAFMDVMEEHFATWGLTPAERDVALFAIKGMSTAEMAALRGVSEGTIKAQTNAIYRKAGVSGRTQLLSLFIDDLIADAGGPRPVQPAEESKSVA